MSWMAVRDPVPPVKPMYAVFPPTMLGILMGQICVNEMLVVASVIFIVRFVPS